MSRIPDATRRRVVERACGLCEYCHSQTIVTGDPFTLDHIDPESRGGGDDLGNLCLCCAGCNSYKQARIEALDPRTDRVVPLFHPRRDVWHEHFRWSPTRSRIIGRTASGRATVVAMQLNRPTLVGARTIWVRHGLHPPQRHPEQ